MELKTVKQIIITSKDDGKKDQEIYNDLSEKYADKKKLALLITGTATNDDKKKYKIYNYILLALLAFTLLSRIILSFSLLSEGAFGDFLLSLIGLILPALFIYGIAQYSSPVYRFCGIMAILGFVATAARQTTASISGQMEFGNLLNLIPLAAIAALCFFLDYKLFPNFKPGKFKTDNNKNFKLN